MSNEQLGVGVVPINLDDMLAKLSMEPVIANDLDQTTREGQLRLNELLYTRYEGDSLNDIPRCSCGSLTGGQYVGTTCRNCKTTCDFDINRELESVLWIRVPEGVHAFINPASWITMSSVMETSKCNALEWLVNPSYRMEDGAPWSVKVQRMEELGIPRGLNHFYENFDAIMDQYFKLFPNRKLSQQEVDLREYIRQYRGLIFCRHIPMMSKVGFVVEENETGSYADQVMPLAIDALRMITSIDRSFTAKTLASRELRTVQCIQRMAQFYTRFIKEVLSKKPGVWRKHVFGGRAHFTGRAVINSLSEAHHYEELHVPWSFACQIFSLHLTNKLLKMGWHPVQIKQHIDTYTLQYCPLLDGLFKEIIAETDYIGYPCLFQRNPTLVRASMQRLYITKVKTDVNINSISISVLIIKGPNADFDGDEMNMMLINDKITHERFSRYAPHQSAISIARPYELSGNLAMSSQVVTTIANYLYEKRPRKIEVE